MAREITHFPYAFVGFRNIVVAVPYVGGGTRTISVNDKKVETLDKVEQFRAGQPVYMTDFGEISCIAYRTRLVHPGEDGIQEAIVAVNTNGSSGVIIELDFAPHWDIGYHTSPNLHRPVPVLNMVADDMLPVYVRDKRVDQKQKRRGPDSLVVLGGEHCVLMRRYWGQPKEIMPDSGRWGRNSPTDLEIIARSERIYATSRYSQRKDNLTDPLYKAGVDIERTIGAMGDFDRWKHRDGTF